MTDARWPAILSKWWPGIGRRLVVHDEQILASNHTGDESHIECLYRQLKDNYEARRDYDRAGDFHYGEKEMRRKNSSTDRGRRLLLWLYWIVSGYGERILRPLACIMFVLLVTTAAYLFGGLLDTNKGTGPTLEWWRVREGLLYSFRTMTLLKFDDLMPNGFCGNLVNTIQSVLGPLLFGLLGLAVRQRLKR